MEWEAVEILKEKLLSPPAPALTESNGEYMVKA